MYHFNGSSFLTRKQVPRPYEHEKSNYHRTYIVNARLSTDRERINGTKEKRTERNKFINIEATHLDTELVVQNMRKHLQGNVSV